jgi:hypothetical protein
MRPGCDPMLSSLIPTLDNAQGMVCALLLPFAKVIHNILNKWEGASSWGEPEEGSICLPL